MVAGGGLHQRAPHPDGLAEGVHARAAVVKEAPALAQREGVGADGVDLRRQQRRPVAAAGRAAVAAGRAAVEDVVGHHAKGLGHGCSCGACSGIAAPLGVRVHRAVRGPHLPCRPLQFFLRATLNIVG